MKELAKKKVLLLFFGLLMIFMFPTHIKASAAEITITYTYNDGLNVGRRTYIVRKDIETGLYLKDKIGFSDSSSNFRNYIEKCEKDSAYNNKVFRWKHTSPDGTVRYYRNYKNYEITEDMAGDFVGCWISNKCEIKIENEQGDIYQTLKFTYDKGDGSNYINVSKRNGYSVVWTFKGRKILFNESSGRLSERIISETVESSGTLVYKLVPYQYPLNFFDERGMLISEKTAYYGSPLGEFPQANKTGYKLRWRCNVGQIGDTGYVTSETVIDDSILENGRVIAIYAKYEPNVYTVFFDARGGSCGVGSLSYAYDYSYEDLPTPTMTGYTFTGWTYNGQLVTNGTQFNLVAADHTLVANYAPNTYTVTFNAAGGSCSAGSKAVVYNGKYGDLPTPTKAGWTFTGWTYNGQKVTSEQVYTLADNQTLVATYVANQYKVAFDAKGGSCATTNKTVTYGGTYGELPTASKQGYSFNGWTYKGKAVTKDTVSNLIAADHTLVADYTPNKYKVNFDANGGSCETKSKEMAYETKIGTLPVPTKDKRVFVGWFIGDNQIFEDTLWPYMEEKTAVAKWEGLPVNMLLDARDGECDKKQITVPHNSDITELPTPSRKGYEFGGWYTEKEGQGTLVQNGQKNTYEEDITLYAYWICKTYTVTFNSEGGSKCDSMKVSYNSKIGTLPSPIRKGYTFDGWYTAKGSKLESDMIWRNYSDITVYAKWTANKYKVKFNPSGGKVSKKSMKVAYDSKWKKIPKPTKKGKLFAGWYTKKNGKGTKLVYNDTFTSTKKVTYYAYWVSKDLKGSVYDGTYKLKSKQKGSFKVSFKKNKAAKGYEIQYSTDKKFNKKKTKTIKTTNNSVTIELVKPKQKYYVRIRAYAEKGSKIVYGKWSSSKKFVAKQ